MQLTGEYRIAKREKYVSEKRDAPRILKSLGFGPIDEPRKERIPTDPNRGILTYRHIDGSLSDIFDASRKSNVETISRDFNENMSLVEKALDIQYKIACDFFWIIEAEPYALVSDVQHVLEPCFKNDLLALKSAEITTREGLYSFARPALRMVFESLMIAKFCSSNHESEIYDKWIDGEVVYFTNGVIKKILKPSSSQFSKFWSLISEYTHSSIYAMQPDNCIENVKEQINLNYLLIHMLSECNYHILNTHIFTKSLRYYQTRYGDPKALSAWRKEITSTYSSLKKSYNKPAREFVRDFKSTWVVDNA